MTASDWVLAAGVVFVVGMFVAALFWCGLVPVGDGHHDSALADDRDQPDDQPIGPENATP